MTGDGVGTELQMGRLPPAPAEPLAAPPARRPSSVRRTSSIDMSWPGGLGAPLHLFGRARDARTTVDGRLDVLAADELQAVIGLERTIEVLETSPPRRGASSLVGARGGSGLRRAIDAALPDERGRSTPLALLLDDIAGASLVSMFAWSRHRADWLTARRRPSGPAASSVQPGARHPLIGICSGFRPGSSALPRDDSPFPTTQSVAAVPPLVDPDDLLGWHVLPPLAEVGMRRARRIDVWGDHGEVRVDAHFRDSCTDPQLGEIAVHEYSVSAAVDGARLVLTEVAATPRVLPYPECPLATTNAARLVGEPLATLRTRVLELLQGVDCCTHLNDTLRALADVAALLPAVVGPVER